MTASAPPARTPGRAPRPPDPTVVRPLVVDVMSAPPVVVRSDAPIAAAAALIEERGVGGLPVVDPSGALVGVLSEVDLMRVHSVDYLWLNRRGLLVRHLMTAPAVSVHASTPAELAARRMERHRVRRLVVVADEDELRPIGVVTAGDLARAVGASARTPSTPAVAGEEPRDA